MILHLIISILRNKTEVFHVSFKVGTMSEGQGLSQTNKKNLLSTLQILPKSSDWALDQDLRLTTWSVIHSTVALLQDDNLVHLNPRGVSYTGLRNQTHNLTAPMYGHSPAYSCMCCSLVLCSAKGLRAHLCVPVLRAESHLKVTKLWFHKISVQ